MQGENAWIFAAEDQVSGCVKAFLDFEKALISEQPKNKKGVVKPTDITGKKLSLSSPIQCDLQFRANPNLAIFFRSLQFPIAL